MADTTTNVPATGGPADSAHARARRATLLYAPAEPRALGAMAIAAAAAILWVVMPVGIGVLFGALMAFTAVPWHRALTRRTRRPVLVALGLTGTTCLLVGGSVAVLSYLLVLQGMSVAASFPQWLTSGGPADVTVHRLIAPLAALGVDPEAVVARLRDAAGNLATSLAGWAAQALFLVMDGLLALFFMAVAMYVFLLEWPSFVRRAERLVPINPRHTRRLMRELQRLGRTVIVGNFGTAVVQGVLTGVGLALGHVPQAAFYGAIAAVASLVPVFGTLIVWVPAGVVLLASGHTGAGLFELFWGSFVVVGLCDYVVRPRLVGRGETMPTWMMYLALFGGIKLFGFVGFLLGPLFVGISVVVLRMYERTRQFRLGLS